MSTPFYLLIGHAVVADHGLHACAELTQTLAKAGWDKAQSSKAAELAELGETLVSRRRSQFEDRIAEHTIHIATLELEMWLQTVRFRLKSTMDKAQITLATGSEIHTHDHTISTIAQALRTLACLRTSPKALAACGSERGCHDVAGRGWTLLSRLLKTTDKRLQVQPLEDTQVFKEIRAAAEQLSSWIRDIDTSASTFTDKSVPLLGHLGYVPSGVGRPLGGAGFGVTLHGSGQGAMPDPDAAFPSTGWSIGRQGRNCENIGKGRVERRIH